MILGTSKTMQLETNLEGIEKGPPPEDMAGLLANIWNQVKVD